LRIQQEEELREEISGRQRKKDKGPAIPVQSSGSESDDDVDVRAASQASLRTQQEDDDRRRGIQSSGGRASSMDDYLYRKRSATQPGIKQAMKGVKGTATAAKGAIKGIVKWFLHAGVPAHTASSPYFQTMVDAIAEAGPGIKAPTSKYIYETGLDEEYAELHKWVDDFKLVWKERGCTLMCDGWTGTTRKSMINFLVYCTEGTVFMKSVDASGKIKNADFLYRLMDELVEEIGEENVVQLVTDNEASYKAAGRLLMEKRRHIYWVPCAAHSIDLMMEDIGKDKHIAKLVSQAQMITTFIYGHNRILNIMRTHTGGRDLLRAGPTRFASNFISLESLAKFRHQLGQTINSVDYLQHVRTLRSDSRQTAREVAELIGSSRFWEKVHYYLKVIEPLVHVLRMVDGDEKNDMGFLYEAMDKAKEKLKADNPRAYRKWWDIIDDRWQMTLHHDMHAAG
jgi:hypothetical protein